MSFALTDSEPPLECAVDLLELHARESLGMPGDWRVYLWKAMPPDGRPRLYTELTGAVTPLVTRGPTRGKPNWKRLDKATVRTTYINPADHEAWVAAWEARTGRCGGCVGKGQVFRSYSRAEGTKTRPCSKCSGSGKPVAGSGVRS